MKPIRFAPLIVTILAAGRLAASERHFAFSYETTVMPKGAMEFENSVTWQARSPASPHLQEFDFRHEIEFGLTDRLLLGVYVANWHTASGATAADDEHENGTRFETSNIELIYSLTDPTNDWLGSAVYFETALGPEKFTLEGKLLLQKNFGPLMVVANVALEAEWEGSHYEEHNAELESSLGIGYQFNPSWSAGIELANTVEFENWKSPAIDHGLYLGPNVSWRRGPFSAVLAPMFRVTRVDNQPDFMTRLIVSWQF